MRTSGLGLPGDALEFLDKKGYAELYPPQAESVGAGLLEGKSVLVSAPTASGKTLIAMLAIMACISRGAGKAIYLSPLRALASEKRAEFGELAGGGVGGVRPTVAVSTGDYDAREAALEAADIIVLTNERMDSLMRHRPAWMSRVGLVISDEIHLIGDADRGPALEMAIAHALSAKSPPQVLGLSATVSNAGEIAEWLGAELVESSWRPVPLAEGVYDGGSVHMADGSTLDVESSIRGPAVDIGVGAVADGGQALVFANTRPLSMSMATKASTAVEPMLSREAAARLKDASDRIVRENERTEAVKTLADLVKKGVAFHHAGLSQPCRSVVEEEFRGGAIRLVTATPTLAAGVNLPARRVVISSLMRFDMRRGMAPISVLDYKQMSGRAGRPQYDDRGEAIIVPGNAGPEMASGYIGAEPEPVESQMLNARAMRIHTLGLLVIRAALKRSQITDFFMGTLAGRQLSKSEIDREVGSALRVLAKKGMVSSRGAGAAARHIASDLGRLVSELYLDPDTATEFLELLDMASDKRDHTLGLVHAIAECGEFYPKAMPRERDRENAESLLDEHGGELVYEVYSNEIAKSTLALNAWVCEETESSIAAAHGVESGDLHRMRERAAWIAHCLARIAAHEGKTGLASEADELERRLAYGIRRELIDLTRVRGVGRVRARELYRAGYRDRKSLAGADARKVGRISSMGKRVAEAIIAQAGQAGARRR